MPRGGGGRVAASAGHITDLTLNDHACLTFGEPEELFDLTAAFVRDGLTDGLRVVWLTGAGPDRVTPELSRRGIEAGAALAAGQLASEPEGRLLSGAAFDTGSAIGWLGAQIAACH